MAKSLPIDDHLRVYFINSLSSIKQKLEEPFFKFPNESYCGYWLTNNENTGPSKLMNVSGIYAFYHVKSGKFYIGSSLSFASRFKQHFCNSTRPIRGGNNKFYSFVKNNGGWPSFIWQPLLKTPQHTLLFIASKPEYRLDANKLSLLRSLTQLEARVIAMLSYFNPELNSTKFVRYGFINWSPYYNPLTKGSMVLKVFNADKGPITKLQIKNNTGLIIEFDSIGNRAVGLGLSKTTVSRYINTTTPVISPLLEMEVFLIEASRPFTNSPIKFTNYSSIPSITDFDLYSLAMGELLALNINKDPINYYGSYLNAAEAAKKLDQKSEYKYISRDINLEHPVEVSPKKDLVSVVKNPFYKANLSLRRTPASSHNTKAIVLVDTLNNTAVHFATIKLMLTDLGITSTGATGFVKRYMQPTKLYKQRYEFHYAYQGLITSYRS